MFTIPIYPDFAANKKNLKKIAGTNNRVSINMASDIRAGLFGFNSHSRSFSVCVELRTGTCTLTRLGSCVGYQHNFSAVSSSSSSTHPHRVCAYIECRTTHHY